MPVSHIVDERDLPLYLERLAVEAARFREDPVDEVARDAMALQIEEPDRPGDLPQLRRDGLLRPLFARQIGRDVENRDFLGGIREIHETDEFGFVLGRGGRIHRFSPTSWL